MCKISTKIIKLCDSWSSSKFLIFQTKYLVSRKQCSKFLFGILHLHWLCYQTIKRNQSIKTNFKLTTRANLKIYMNENYQIILKKRSWNILLDRPQKAWQHTFSHPLKETQIASSSTLARMTWEPIATPTKSRKA